MKPIAGVVGLSDAGEGLLVAARGESAQQLSIEFASSAGAVMADVHIDTGLNGPLEGSQALEWLAVRESDDLLFKLEDKPFVGGAETGDTSGHLGYRWDVNFPADRGVLDVGAVNRSAGSGILCRSRTHATPGCFHLRHLPADSRLATPQRTTPATAAFERSFSSAAYSGAMAGGDPEPDAGAEQDLRGNGATPTVFIATPMYGGVATGLYTVSMVQLSATFLRNRVDSVYATSWTESLVTNARNGLTRQFLQSQATHLMWIDADIGFNPTDIVSMLIADKDIVCGIYPRKEIDWARVARAVEAGVPPEDLSNYAGSFAIKLFDDTAGGYQPDPDGLIEIDAGGTGFMLIKRGVFDALSDGVPEYVLDQRVIKEFYATSIEAGSGRLITEDYHFCRLARSHGFKIYAAPWVRLSHAGTYVFERRFDPNWLELNDEYGR